MSDAGDRLKQATAAYRERLAARTEAAGAQAEAATAAAESTDESEGLSIRTPSEGNAEA